MSQRSKKILPFEKEMITMELIGTGLIGVIIGGFIGVILPLAGLAIGTIVFTDSWMAALVDFIPYSAPVCALIGLFWNLARYQPTT
ncbi:MAG: hypothetical protein QNJ45_15600 [Ardenticatenaceae bacterium]|nr:hypothetical protein [Ardenticatenaceae bacterium]